MYPHVCTLFSVDVSSLNIRLPPLILPFIIYICILKRPLFLSRVSFLTKVYHYHVLPRRDSPSPYYSRLWVLTFFVLVLGRVKDRDTYNVSETGKKGVTYRLWERIPGSQFLTVSVLSFDLDIFQSEFENDYGRITAKEGSGVDYVTPMNRGGLEYIYKLEVTTSTPDHPVPPLKPGTPT